MGVRGLYFKVADFIGLVHCLLEGQNEVGSVGILLSLRLYENVYCVSHSNTELCSR